MSILWGLGARARGLFADNKGPWGPTGGDGDEPPSSEGGGGGGGPWGEPPKRGRRSPQPQSPNVASFEDFLRRSKARFGDGGGGGGLPGRPAGPFFKWAILGILLVWLVFTSTHIVAPGEQGVVTRFGRYTHTLSPGVGLTMPWPINRVQKIDVENIQTVDLGTTGTETLMLTGDQNIVDIAYSVRWNIREPELYLFELAQPDETIREVAESAMRAVVSGFTLNDTIGEGRGDIETRVQAVMQQVLNNYRSGVRIQGIAIKQADPPAAVNDAFKEVSAAQQEAQSYINQARAYALQLTAKAEGEATAFDKVYEQYSLSPDVTKRRMYYETMERVLANVDKTIVEPSGVTPYLPLPQVQKSAPRGATP
jgi:membrane protease subunit HflK